MGGFTVDRAVIAGAVAAENGQLSWSEMRERRRTIVERQQQHERRRRHTAD
jgi:hypothetical protein